MSERVMASIERIVAIEPIEGADKIVKATVKGWSLVTAIDNGFKVGDLVVYCEIDSWIPHDVAPFLSKGQYPRVYNGVEGERLKTIKLRGQVSQGLILPLEKRTDEILGEVYVVTRGSEFLGALQEGDDVSEFLGIQKWEAPIPACLAGVSKGSFPSQIPKTDEERIQNIKSRDFETFLPLTFSVEEKLDGSSATIGYLNGDFIVCSRNLNLKQTEGNTFWEVAIRYNLAEKMRDFDNLVIQGELVGPGIQKNRYNLKQHEIYVFSVYDITQARYYNSAEKMEFCLKLGLNHVPVLGEYQLSVLSAGLGITPVEVLLNYADGKSALNPATLREGVVLKCKDNAAIHFKVISNKFLLAGGD